MAFIFFYTLYTFFTLLVFLKGEEIEWGEKYGGVASELTSLDCSFEDNPICCSGLVDNNVSSSNTISNRNIDYLNGKGHCKITRVYNPSPYEKRHFKKTIEK